MKSTLATLLATLLTGLLVPGGALAADFHEGLAAHERGDYEAALREWRPLAERGDVESQYRLARMYFHGEGVKDDGEAAKWYGRAAEQGHAKAQNNLGLIYELGRGVETDAARAVAWYRRAAAQELVTAQANLARMIDLGHGVERDAAEAATWYRRAGERGHAEAQHRLGVMYQDGTGVPVDLGKAATWYRRAARQGHGQAQAALGSMYLEGRGVSRDLEKATKWLSRASAQGIVVDPFASSAAAEVSRTMVPVVAAEPVSRPAPPPPRASEAPAPVRAAEGMPSDSGGESVTGVAPPVAPPPAREPVVEPTPAREAAVVPVGFAALGEAIRGAEGGDAAAQYRLAQMYATGEGAPQSLDDASRWYLAAAGQGHGMAAYKLAFLHYRGRGVPGKDFVQALRWFSVAGEMGVGDADRWRERIRKKMTEREIAEVERLLVPRPSEGQDE